jgi:hypothetical protein
MKIERKTHRDGNLYPEVYNYLQAVPESILFHADYRERHPFSIYSNSIQRVVKSLKSVLSEIDHLSVAPFNTDRTLSRRLDKLPELQKEVLSAMQSHVDDCYRILKTLHPSDTVINERFVERWLDKAKHPTYKEFREKVKDYRDSFSPIFNKIKHNGGQIRAVVICSSKHGISAQDLKTGISLLYQDVRIFGYFLEGVQEDGCIGPDPDIHPDGKTAISLNRDLRFHFANLYRIAHHLKTAMVKAVRMTHTLNLPYPSSASPIPDQNDLEEIADKITSMPSLFFENEFSKSTPNVLYQRTGQSSQLILEFPGTRQLIWTGDTSLYGEFQVDPICLEYRVPYL